MWLMCGFPVGQKSAKNSGPGCPKVVYWMGPMGLLNHGQNKQVALPGNHLFYLLYWNPAWEKSFGIWWVASFSSRLWFQTIYHWNWIPGTSKQGPLRPHLHKSMSVRSTSNSQKLPGVVVTTLLCIASNKTTTWHHLQPWRAQRHEAN